MNSRDAGYLLAGMMLAVVILIVVTASVYIHECAKNDCEARQRFNEIVYKKPEPEGRQRYGRMTTE
jgi:hypothetical protein